jgi:hypothetical protein
MRSRSTLDCICNIVDHTVISFSRFHQIIFFKKGAKEQCKLKKHASCLSLCIACKVVRPAGCLQELRNTLGDFILFYKLGD